MPDPITWYTLGRTVSDPETIMEEVDAKLLVHNQDPSAHGQSGEGVFEHRNAAFVDHVNYSIYNIKLAINTRTVKAFCDVGGAAEFEKIVDAIEYVNAHGGGAVFVKAGTYTQTSDITLYSDVEVRGEDADTTIVDFNGGAYGFRVIGVLGNPLRNIRLRGISIENSTDATEGAVRFDYVDDSLIEDCKFDGNWNAGLAGGNDIRLDNCNRIDLSRNRHENSGYVLDVSGGSDIWVRHAYVDNPSAECILAATTARLHIDDSVFTNCLATVIEGNGAGLSIYIDGNRISTDAGNGIDLYTNVVAWISRNDLAGGNTATYGISLDSMGQPILLGNRVLQFSSDGVYLTTVDDAVLLGNNISSNGGYGVNISDAACDRTDIRPGNILVANTSGDINDLGTDTKYVWGTFVFTVDGNLAVGTDVAPTLSPATALVIDKVYAIVKTAPTGAVIIVDVNKNGTTIFTTQANRPQIAIGATEDESGTPDVTALAKNDKVTVDIDQVGSVVTGADLTVLVRVKQHPID